MLPPDLLKDFTAAELARFDGIQSSKIYIALDGIVFDCSQGSDFYELGQGYHCLAGRDGSKVCGYMNMKAEVDLCFRTLRRCDSLFLLYVSLYYSAL